jgi:hypothetical protein
MLWFCPHHMHTIVYGQVSTYRSRHETTYRIACRTHYLQSNSNRRGACLEGDRQPTAIDDDPCWRIE